MEELRAPMREKRKGRGKKSSKSSKGGDQVKIKDADLAALLAEIDL